MTCPSRQERSEIAARLRNRRREMESEKPPADPIFAAFVYLTNVMGAVRVGEGGNLFNRLADLIDPEERTDRWISVDDRLPDCKGEYIVAYHPCQWDRVATDKTIVGLDSFRGKASWAKRKYQRVTHWMPKPEPPKVVDA